MDDQFWRCANRLKAQNISPIAQLRFGLDVGGVLSRKTLIRRLRPEWSWLRSFEHSPVSCRNVGQNEYQGHSCGGNRFSRLWLRQRKLWTLVGRRVFLGTPSIPIGEKMQRSAASGTVHSNAAWTRYS